MYKIVNKRAPDYLIDLFEKSNSVYSLRESGSRLTLPKYNTEFAKGSSFGGIMLSLFFFLLFSYVGMRVQ